MNAWESNRIYTFEVLAHMSDGLISNLKEIGILWNTWRKLEVLVQSHDAGTGKDKAVGGIFETRLTGMHSETMS